MDIEFLKSTPENQMEMMITMMQFETIPEFYIADHVRRVNQITEFPDDRTSTSSSNPTANMPDFSSNNPPAATISFSGSGNYSQEGELSLRGRNGGEAHSPAVQKHNMVEMREMLFKIAAMQPVDVDPESVKAPKRRNVKVSKDPQSVAARHRRERISERIRVLQRLVPGGTKMDTASMLDEAIHYMKFLKKQVQSMEKAAVNGPGVVAGMSFPVPKTYPFVYTQYSK